MTGLDLIKAERQRQIEVECYDAQHDDEHGAAVLADAAKAFEEARSPAASMPACWPWNAAVWNPQTRERNLIRAGALYDAAADAAERGGDIPVRDALRGRVNYCAGLLDVLADPRAQELARKAMAAKLPLGSPFPGMGQEWSEEKKREFQEVIDRYRTADKGGDLA